MSARRRLAAVTIAAALAAAPALAQGQRQQDGAVVARTERATAIVESVDQRARTVVLRREDDSLVTIRVGPEVRNLPQVRAGDRVVVEHTEAVAARMAKPGQPPVEAAEAFERAPVGQRPAAASADAVRVRVKIDAVTDNGQSVSFTGPTGAKRTIPVRSANMQAFARTLSPGDEVDLTFLDVVAIRVEPVR